MKTTKRTLEENMHAATMVSLQYMYLVAATLLLLGSNLAPQADAGPQADSDNCSCKLQSAANRVQPCSRDVSVSELVPDHRAEIVGLVGDCMPEVEVNTRKCFKVRVKNCGLEQERLQCTLHPRDNYYENFGQQLHDQAQYLSLSSPMYERRRYKRTFCVYNVSTEWCDGPVEIHHITTSDNVSITPGNATTQSCNDYVQFDFGDSYSEKLCGDKLRKYTSGYIYEKSFVVVFWSARSGKGAFRLGVQCYPTAGISSGQGTD